MTGMLLCADIRGVSVLGPGLPDWAAAEAVLAGRMAYSPTPVSLPMTAGLPPAERRRTGAVVRLAIAVGLEAAGSARLDPKKLLAVFSTSAGDGDNCHEILQTLASAERHLSPTRFQNSVHNAPAGYWSIATGAMTASTALCAYNGSFCAGLLEALVQVASQPLPVLLIAYDCEYPRPLTDAKPIADPFGIGLVLTQSGAAGPLGKISARLGDGEPDRLQNTALDALRSGIPAGRGLPLLAMLARGASGPVAVEYLRGCSLLAEVQSC